MVEVRVVEEGFGGNATDVETSSAKRRPLLDASDLESSTARIGTVTGTSYIESFLASFDGGDVARDAAADDNQVLL
jgi:hypothetical protein